MLHPNGDARSTNVIITGAKNNGNHVDCFKASRKNYWLARLSKQAFKISKSRYDMFNKYDSRRLRQISNIFRQDFHTHAVC